MSPTLGSVPGTGTSVAGNHGLHFHAPWASLGAAAAPSSASATDAAKPETAAPAGLLAAASPIRSNAPNVSNFKQRGRASWYGRGFHGRRTASGERYDMNALTAAHRTLPLSSYVRVTNVKNDKSVIVRINDRGPFERGRIIDLSRAAAKVLGMQHSGTARVDIQGLSAQQAQAERAEMLASNK